MLFNAAAFYRSRCYFMLRQQMDLSLNLVFFLKTKKPQTARRERFPIPSSLISWWMSNRTLVCSSSMVRKEECIFICSHLVFLSIVSKPIKFGYTVSPWRILTLSFSLPFFVQEFKQLFGCWSTHWRISMFTGTQNQSSTASRRRTGSERKGFDV